MIGLDLLGLGHKRWPVKTTIEVLPQGCAIGCFDLTFGNVTKSLRRVLNSGKVPAVRVQLWWDNNHQICPLGVIQKRAPVYQMMSQEFSQVKFYLSHSCEHNGNAAQVSERMALLKKLAPNCVPVNSPWKGAIAKGEINEKHGDAGPIPGAFMVSTDGTNIYDIDADKFRSRNTGSVITFLWGHRFNLRELTKPGQVVPPPSERTAIPSKEYLKGVIRLMQTEELSPCPAPIFTQPVKPIEKPLLYKSFSEDSQGKDDPRENRPCLIISAQGAHADILTYQNKVIGRLAYGGTFEGGLHRYYSGMQGGVGLYGYEIARRADTLSGSEFVWFRVGSKIFGPVNPAFRRGYFRD